MPRQTLPWRSAFPAPRNRFNNVQTALRQVYQSPRVETVGLAALVLHTCCGVLQWSRRQRGRARKGAINTPSRGQRSWTRRVTGRVLAIAVAAHVVHFRIVPHIAGQPTDFAGISHFMHRMPFLANAGLGLLLACGIAHTVYAGSFALRTMLGGGRTDQSLHLDAMALVSMCGGAAAMYVLPQRLRQLWLRLPISLIQPTELSPPLKCCGCYGHSPCQTGPPPASEPCCVD